MSRSITIQKGLNLPISGQPEQVVGEAPPVRHVAICGPDYHGMKPTMHVSVGDRVSLGQVLFTDKKTPGVQYTSPGGGMVSAINRGQRRALLSVVIQLDQETTETFAEFDEASLDNLDRETVRDNLVASGLWTALRQRPMSRVPSPEAVPDSIFITAIDTNPLAADPAPIIDARREDFLRGVKVISRLTAGPVYLCTAPGADIPGEEVERVEKAEFTGPHPVGLVGTHIHFLDPVGRNRTAWHIGYQDVIAIGSLFVTGRIDVERVVSLAGPAVKEPRLIRTRLGASLDELCEDQLKEGVNRIVSGSILCGRKAKGPEAYLGRYHVQIGGLADGIERGLFAWLLPGFKKFSLRNVFAGRFFQSEFDMTTAQGGSPRAILPFGNFEKVMPLDILPTFLLRALEMDDIEQAEALGCLELDEEDLGLCTFVCPGKGHFGQMLRRNLTQIEKEG